MGHASGAGQGAGNLAGLAGMAPHQQTCTVMHKHMAHAHRHEGLGAGATK